MTQRRLDSSPVKTTSLSPRAAPLSKPITRRGSCWTATCARPRRPCHPRADRQCEVSTSPPAARRARRPRPPRRAAPPAGLGAGGGLASRCRRRRRRRRLLARSWPESLPTRAAPNLRQLLGYPSDQVGAQCADPAVCSGAEWHADGSRRALLHPAQAPRPVRIPPRRPACGVLVPVECQSNYELRFITSTICMVLPHASMPKKRLRRSPRIRRDLEKG